MGSVFAECSVIHNKCVLWMHGELSGGNAETSHIWCVSCPVLFVAQTWCWHQPRPLRLWNFVHDNIKHALAQSSTSVDHISVESARVHPETISCFTVCVPQTWEPCQWYLSRLERGRGKDLRAHLHDMHRSLKWRDWVSQPIVIIPGLSAGFLLSHFSNFFGSYNAYSCNLFLKKCEHQESSGRY